MTLTSHMLLPDIQAQTGAALLPSNKKKDSSDNVHTDIPFITCLNTTIEGDFYLFFLNEQLYFH